MAKGIARVCKDFFWRDCLRVVSSTSKVYTHITPTSPPVASLPPHIHTLRSLSPAARLPARCAVARRGLRSACRSNRTWRQWQIGQQLTLTCVVVVLQREVRRRGSVSRAIKILGRNTPSPTQQRFFKAAVRPPTRLPALNRSSVCL